MYFFTMAFNYLNSNFAAFAHRGGANDFVENTLEAFEQSINLGYKYIETDVQATKDNKLVIFHDSDLKRMLDKEIDIASIDYDELCKYKINGIHKIPTFLEAVNSWPEINFNIDPKSQKSAELLINELKSVGNLDRFCIGSFDSHKLYKIREAFDDKICTSMGTNEVVNFYFLRFFGINNISTPCIQIPYYRRGFKVITAGLIEDAHKFNKKVHAWTIDDPNQMNELIDMGIDGIMTDSPELLKTVLAKKRIGI